MPYKGLNSTGAMTSGEGAVALREFIIADAYGTAIPHGDPVALSSGYIVSCADNQVPVGVLRGVRYVSSTGEVVRARNYTASTTSAGVLPYAGGETGEVVALIEMAKGRSFWIETADAALAQSDVGSSKALKTLATADTYGNSTCVVDMDLSIGTASRLVRILGLAGYPGNAYGSGAVAEVEFVNSVGDAT